MSDDKKVIFSMNKVSKTYQSYRETSIKRYLFKFLLRSKNWNSWFKWIR